MGFRNFFPFLDWLPGYRGRDLRRDAAAGVTVGVMLIPQGMAYALLAGLPPVYGLYASIVPLLLYGFFGTSRQLSVGPTALVSLLVLTGVERFAEPGTALFISLAISTGLLAGIIQLVLGFSRLGFLVNFLSHPVISGFTSAAAVIIGLSQLKNLLGIPMPRSNYLHEILYQFFQLVDQTHWPTLLMGLGSILLLLGLRRISKVLPAALILVVLSIVVVYAAGLEDTGIAIVGEVPPGLPSFQVPVLDGERINQIFPLALTICLISFIESLAIAKKIEAKQKSYRVVPNQELLALGIAKIGGAFFQSFPTTGSFTRSAINQEAGAQTGIASAISAGFVALVLLFFTPLFYYLPKAALASIIIVAVAGLVDYREAKQLWLNDRRDFLTLITTFLATLTLGIQSGVLFGVLLSIALMIFKNSRPHYAVLGRLPNSSTYRSINRFREAKEEPEILIFRFDAQLYFGNANFFRETIEEQVGERNAQLDLFILDCSSIHDIDSTGIHALEEVIEFLDTRQISLFLTGVIGPVRDTLYKYGLIRLLGKQHYFLKVHDAVKFYRSREAEEEGWTYRALQTNVKKDRRKNKED